MPSRSSRSHPEAPSSRSTVAGVALALAGVPLAMWPLGHSPFGPVKLAVTLIAAALVAAGLAVSPDAAARVRSAIRSPLVWALGAYVGLALLSLVTAVDVRAAVLGTYPAYTGLVSLAAWLVVGAGAVSLGPGRARVLVGRAACVAVAGVSAYALAQLLGLDPLGVPEGIDAERVRSTLGNASNLGAYLVLALPLVADRVLAEDARGWRVLSWIALPAGAMTLAATGSRGALAAIVVAAIGGAVLLRRSGTKPGGASKRVLAMAGVTLVAAALLAPGAGARLAGGGSASATTSGRAAAWVSTAPMIVERPFLGWGPNAYGRVHPRYASESEADPYARPGVLDDPHNALLSAAAGSGALAPLALLALAWLSAAHAWRVATGTEGAWASACAAGLAGFAVSMQVHFVTLDTGAAALVLLGGLVGCGLARGEAVTPSRSWRPAWLAGAALCACLVVAALGAVAGDTAVRFGFPDPEQPMFGWNPGPFDAAIRLAPWEPAFVWAKGRAARDTLAYTADSDDEPRIVYGEGVAALKLAERRIPDDFRVLRDLGDLGVAAGVSGVDAGWADAEGAYSAALELAPTDALSYLGRGVAGLGVGDPAGAIRDLGRATELAPLMPEAWENLALAYEADGQLAKAGHAEAKARELAGP